MGTNSNFNMENTDCRQNEAAYEILKKAATLLMQLSRSKVAEDDPTVLSAGTAVFLMQTEE